MADRMVFGRRGVTAEETERALNMRRRGHSLGKIARMLCVDVQEVRDAMYPRPSSLVARRDPRKVPLRVQEEVAIRLLRARRARSVRIQRLWLRGLTAQQIADELEDLGVGGVQNEIQRLREAGWDLPKRKPGPRKAEA